MISERHPDRLPRGRIYRTKHGRFNVAVHLRILSALVVCGQMTDAEAELELGKVLEDETESALDYMRRRNG